MLTERCKGQHPFPPLPWKSANGRFHLRPPPRPRPSQIGHPWQFWEYFLNNPVRASENQGGTGGGGGVGWRLKLASLVQNK